MIEPVKIKRDLLILILASISATLAIWLPFYLDQKGGLFTLFKNFDGPNYLVVEKTWYNKTLILSRFSLPSPAEYYSAHLPGYPLSIFLLNFLFRGPTAMLLSSLFFTILATITFYLFLQRFKLSQNPLWLALVFLVLPARWVVVKAVGSPEPLFIFAILASFYFFKKAFAQTTFQKKNFLLNLTLAGIFGALAQITKSPGILLFAGYVFYLLYQLKTYDLKPTNLYQHLLKPLLPLSLIPLSALAVFGFYQLRTGDFWAYFHSGDNFHLVFPPFQAFTNNGAWLGDFWREDLIWQYLIGALAVITLFKKKLHDLASFAATFFAATLFVAHRDLARYSLPLVPFALIAFDELIQKKEFKIVLLIILPAIYLYAIHFIAGNTAPVADWTPYL